MPRLSAVRVEALRELVDQLRFSSASAAAKHIDRAESLAAELDMEQTYPLEWVLFRLTDYRSTEIDGLVTGEALLRDLSAIVERLCAQARLTREDLPEHLTLAELTERWNVSTKSIERYRRRGLIARRATTGSASTPMLAFTRVAVERFEAEHAMALKSAKRFDRLTEAQSDSAVRRIERYQRSLGWSRAQAIDRTAHRMARAPETLRLLMKQRAPNNGGPDASDSQLIDAWWRGESAAAMGHLAGLAPSTAHGRLLNARADRLLGLRASLKPEQDRVRHLASLDELLSPDAVRTELSSGGPLSLAELLEAMHTRTVPVGAHERLLGQAIVGLRMRAHASLERLTPRAPALDAIETDLRWASRLKATLARPMLFVMGAQLREVLGPAADRLGSSEWQLLTGLSISSMSAALDRWDPWSQGRPAGAVSVAVGKTAARWLAAHPQSHRENTAVRLTTTDAAIDDWTRSLDPWQAWLEPPMLAGTQLQPEALALYQARFGLAGDRPHTVETLAIERGTTPRAIETNIRRVLRQLVGS